MFAVNGCHKDIVQRLVSAGADVHIRDKVCGNMESVCQMLHVFHITTVHTTSENVVLWCWACIIVLLIVMVSHNKSLILNTIYTQ